MILAAESIHKSYGAFEVLRDCSLELESGQCLLLRGPSGGGKSTLLRILAGLETADSGVVHYGDHRWDAHIQIRQPAYPFLTMVFQQLFLWPNLSMQANLSLVLNHGLNRQLPPKAFELLERFNIAQILGRHPHECSLGQRQRLAIARALLSDAKFLLLDEPSSALDKANRQVLVEELKTALGTDRGVLLITHDEGSYDGLAADTLELEEGLLTRC